MSTYLDKLLDRVGERVADRVVARLEATLDVLSDRELLDDLKRADEQPDEEAISLDAVRRARTS